MRLDGDEFTFVKEPYELLGGDYTVGYLKDGQYWAALRTVAKSYYLYWNYRPLFSPIVSEQDKALFRDEERRFGYVRPYKPAGHADKSESLYQKRLVVPEPDRFYAHGAGKPLLPAIANVVPMAVTSLAVGGRGLLKYQFSRNYHPAFILVRLAPILAGLASLLAVYFVTRHHLGQSKAAMAVSLFVLFPPVMLYFPNIHHDAYMIPFLIGAAHFYVIKRYVLAGVLFGLALASKNAAVFMLLPALGYAVWEGYRSYRAGAGTEALEKQVLQSGAGLVKMALVALLVLLPFANPVSYAQEILTPLTQRAYDTRGEQVNDYFLAADPDQVGAGGMGGDKRPSMRLVNKMFPFSFGLIFVFLALVAAGSKMRNRISVFSLLVLLAIFPYSLIYGDGLGYRSLLFVPFFAILAADLSNRRAAAVAASALGAIALVVLADPLTIYEGTGSTRTQRINDETVWQAYRTLMQGTDGSEHVGTVLLKPD